MRSHRREAGHFSTKDGARAPAFTPLRRKAADHAAPRDSTLALGNQALQRLRSGVLAGRGLSQPGDQRETQAQRTAERVLSMPTPTQAIKSQPNGSTSGNGTGQALPESVRSYFEPRFGTSLEHVRIRNDHQAALEAHALEARAFTHGNVISFAHGQYAPHSREGLQLLAHELAHVTQDASSNTVHRETWKVDDGARTIERGVLVQLHFFDRTRDRLLGEGWTPERKATFRSKFVSGIQDTFNNSSFIIKPPQEYGDVLPKENIEQGYKPQVDVQLVPEDEWSVSEDWEVTVTSNKKGEDRESSSDRKEANLDEADVDPTEKKSSAPGVKQIEAVHEFGHFIGLDHPGYGLSAKERSPGANQYGHTGKDRHGHDVDGPNDLMGSGMQLRAFYFDDWARALDRHVAALRARRQRREMLDRLPWWAPLGGFPPM